jgi:hypothetical protein
VFQPRKVDPVNVNAFVVKAEGELPDSGAIVPVPPLALKVTCPTYVYAAGPVAVPPGQMITTFFAPKEVPAGVVMVIEVDELTVKLVTGIPSIVTEVAPVKLVPVMTAEVPPAIEPEEGEMEVKVGIGGVVKLATGLKPANGEIVPGGELIAADW